MTAPRRVLIVGAGLAGARCAETLRANGFDGELRLVGAEPFPPYERPALSKEHLAGSRDAASLELRPRSFWDERGIELLLGRRVVGVDRDQRTALDRPRRGAPLGRARARDGRHAREGSRAGADPACTTLRTLADAAALRAGAASRAHAWPSSAPASSAPRSLRPRSRSGASVTLVDVARAPLERVLGDEVGSLLAARYAEAGVDLRLGAARRAQRARRRRRRRGGRSRSRDRRVRRGERHPDRRLRPNFAAGRLRRGRRRRGLASAARPAPAGRALDERRGPGRRGGARDPRRGASARCAAVLLVGSVRTAAPVRRPRRDVGAVELEGEPDSFVARYATSTARPSRRSPSNRPAEVGALRTELTAVLEAEQVAA